MSKKTGSGRWFALALGLSGFICPNLGHAQTNERDLNVVKRCEKGSQFILGDTPTTIPLKLDLQQQKQLASSMKKESLDPGLLLRLGGFKASASQQYKGGRVFLNLPTSTVKNNPDLLGPSSPYYVGSFSFYPMDGEDSSFYLTPGPVLARLKDRCELSDIGTLHITVVGIPNARPDAVVPFKASGVMFSEVALKTKTQEHPQP